MTTSLRPRTLVSAAAVIAALVAPAAASAASAPTVATGAASKIAQTTATVRGTVDPNDVETSYSFEYGPSKAYGAATPPVAVGKGTSPQAAVADLAGLAPFTTYNYRLVATSGAGTSRGANRSFKTLKQPLGLSLAATPNPVAFGAGTTLAGALTGTDNANRQVLLEQNAFPFTAGFAAVGNAQVTNATGTFVFPILSLTTTTQYRAVVPGRPVVSPIVTATVVTIVRTNVSATRVRRGRSVVFSGSITPRRDGSRVVVQKLSKGRWLVVAGTFARRSTATDRSRYAVRVKVPRGGSYRVLVATNTGDVVGSVGRTVKISSFR